MKKYKISGKLERFPGKGGWTFLMLPKSVSANIHKITPTARKTGWGFIPIEATLGKSTWSTSLLPGRGDYFIAIKASVRKCENVAEGDTVTVTFQL